MQSALKKFPTSFPVTAMDCYQVTENDDAKISEPLLVTNRIHYGNIRQGAPEKVEGKAKR